MATSYTRDTRGPLPFQPNALIGRRSVTSTSNKVNNRVDLTKQSPHSFQNVSIRNALVHGSWSGTPAIQDASIFYGPTSTAMSQAEQVALAKWRGKLRKGDASLGVSLASWAQSRDMIISRFKKVLPPLTKTERALGKLRSAQKRGEKIDRRYLNRLARGRASDVLEVEFGWLPLFSDIHSALFTVCQDGVPPSWVAGRHTFVEQQRTSNDFRNVSILTAGRVTVASTVEIANLNLWLLNRLGLINPATVIWDLIPWSFVVNMLVNVNAILESLTDTVGLNISNQSVTKSYSCLAEVETFLNPSQRALGNYASNVNYHKNRVRTVGSIPAVKLAVKVPELNWELALIAGSLVVQKMNKISKLVTALTAAPGLKPQLLK